MSMVLKKDGTQRLVTKGASELVLDTCNKFKRADGQVVPIDQAMLTQIQKAIEDMANQALRTICVAYKDLNGSEDLKSKDDKGVYSVEKDGLTLCWILGIKDILR